MNKTLWLTDPDASAMDVLFGIAGGIISGVFLKRMCDIKNIGPVISKIALLGGYASQVKAIENAITNEQWDQVITHTFHLTLSILALSDNCFTGETLVASENGQIRIDEIKVGDKVWAYDIFTGETELKEVLTVYVHEVDEILHLYTSCGDIDTTTNHPFYVIERGWVAAGDLVEGDEIYLLDGTVAYVTGSELEQLSETIKVYNLEVSDFNTYFVGDEAVLVHNYNPKSRNQMQKDVDAKRAPKGVDRVDPPHNPNVPEQKAHVHFKDGTSMNYDGTPHDKKHGIPNITNKIAEWLESFDWSSVYVPDNKK